MQEVECIICTDLCTNKLTCGHYYHIQCIKQWVEFRKIYKCYCSKLFSRDEIERIIGIENIQVSEDEKCIDALNYLFELKPICFDKVLLKHAIEVYNYILVKFIITHRLNIAINQKNDIDNFMSIILMDEYIVQDIELLKSLNADNCISNSANTFIFNTILSNAVIDNKYNIIEYLFDSCTLDKTSQFVINNVELLHHASNNFDIFKLLITNGFTISNDFISKIMTKSILLVTQYIYENVRDADYKFSIDDCIIILKYGISYVLKYVITVCDNFMENILKLTKMQINDIIRTCSIDTFIYLCKIDHITDNIAVGLYNSNDHELFPFYNAINNISYDDDLKYIFQIGEVCHIQYILDNELLPDDYAEDMFDIACKYNNYDIVRLLIKNNIHGGKQILDYLFIHKKIEYIDLLLNSGYTYICSENVINDTNRYILEILNN